MPIRVETFERLEDAASALSSNRNARFLGGGTILMRGVNEANQGFDTLIRVTDQALKEVRAEGGDIAIGAGVTMNEIIRNRDLAFLAPAARAVGGPAIRSAATIGGNLYARAPYGDFATALMALGATVQFAGPSSGQGVSIDDFLRDRDRDHGRIIRSVLVPRPVDTNALRFLKVSRVKPKGVALMTIAAYLPRSGSQISGFRVAYGNMGPAPLRASAVERALEGASMDEAGITRALSAATEGITPPTDGLATEWYRREVAPVHLKRVLLGQAR